MFQYCNSYMHHVGQEFSKSGGGHQANISPDFAEGSTLCGTTQQNHILETFSHHLFWYYLIVIRCKRFKSKEAIRKNGKKLELVLSLK